MEQMDVAGSPSARWWKRENLVPGLMLLGLTGLAWIYTVSSANLMNAGPMPADMGGMTMPVDQSRLAQSVAIALFLVAWTIMMAAMMLPSVLPLILIYRTVARKQWRATQVMVGMGALVAGYFIVWLLTGLPVFAYNRLITMIGPLGTLLPGVLLICGGVYQWSALKQRCHGRCSNPLFFLMNRWRAGPLGAVRLGIAHGIDCMGCCLGLMLALVGLGIMHLAVMLSAALLIFVEKALPGGHRVARPLGLLLIFGGVVLLYLSLRELTTTDAM
ncbi:MAG: DUF2182 domain-containing protein [Herpetosiphon sp.]